MGQAEERIQKLELMDEFEEWHLIQGLVERERAGWSQKGFGCPSGAPYTSSEHPQASSGYPGDFDRFNK